LWVVRALVSWQGGVLLPGHPLSRLRRWASVYVAFVALVALANLGDMGGRPVSEVS